MHDNTAETCEGLNPRSDMPRHPWKASALASAVVLGMLGVGADAQALALGAVTVRSSLGEALRAEIEVPQISSEEAASFQATIASPQAFQAAGVDFTPALAGARVTLHRRANGQAYLRLVGDRPVNEPFVGVVIEAQWATGRVVRDYTMLVDPPGRAAPPPVTVAPSQVAAAPRAPAPAAAPAVAQAPVPSPAVAAPTRRAPARATPVTSGDGGSITVQRGDTASGIVSAHAIDGVSLDQMLIALLRANPKAFINGNVNLVRAGAVLNLPTEEQANAVSHRNARRTVLAQTREFHAYRRSVAQNARATQTASATRDSAGAVQAQVKESQAPAPSQDRLTLSRGGSAAGAEAAAQSRQAQEQTERVAELNKNLSELAQLQSASGVQSTNAPGINVPIGAGSAAASASASASVTAPAAEASAAVAAPDTAAAASAPDTTAVASAPDTAAVASAAETASAAEPAATSASAPATDASAPDAAASAPAASAPEAAASASQPAAAAEPTQTEKPGLLDKLKANPLLAVAIAALIALLAALGLSRSRQRKQQAGTADSAFPDSQPDSFFDPPSDQKNDPLDATVVAPALTSAHPPDQLNIAGDVDPVAEADVYLAYGRDAEAEEILKESLREHPTRVALHRKLAEIYFKRGDARALRSIASDAHGVTHGEGANWLAIAALGRELDPENPLYQPAGAPLTRTSPLVAPSSIPTDAFVDLDLDPGDLPPLRATAGGDAPVDPGLVLAPPAALGPTPAPAAKNGTPGGTGDFDFSSLSLDLDTPAADDPVETKLALAEKFQAMGDIKGARTLLEEVIAEASGDAKARAERLLARLG